MPDESEELEAKAQELEQKLRESWVPASAREEIRNELEHIYARMGELEADRERHKCLSQLTQKIDEAGVYDDEKEEEPNETGH
jgi:hypothetical protein